MAKIGDHVDTTYGNGTIITGKRIQIHGKKNYIVSYEDNKKIIRGVIRTRLQVEEYITTVHKKFMKSLKESKVEKVVKEKVSKDVIKKKAAPRLKKVSTLIYDDFIDFDDDF